ncbi:hypothetical protein SAY87_010229 [Trapa incisa]|uniref:Aminoacyl-tRNA synthetase class II (D/K/N) domain-containing protein n=1 Tax=Trapa incisa TaxID=236973 RepID=A0AAN7JHU6_9MYRT|nr:hypothetical protein SAY87_010229 [Trapa incisa]
MDAIQASEATYPHPKPNPLALFKYSKRVLLKTLLMQEDGGLGCVGERIVIGGWVKSSREEKVELPNAAPSVADEQKGSAGQEDVSCVEILQTRIPLFRSLIKVFGGVTYIARPRLEAPPASPKPLPSIAYLQVSDGSCVSSLQVVVDSSLASPSQLLPTGTCILVEGVLKQPMIPGKHAVELKADKILHIGTVEQSSYVFSKKRLPLDMLRSCMHFRPRTTTVGSVMKVRSSLTFATHTFFQNNGFLNVQVPIITSTDSDGSREKFLITAISSSSYQEDPKLSKDRDNISLHFVKAAAKEKNALIEELKRTESNKEALAAAIQDLKNTNELALQLEAREKSKAGASMKADAIKSSQNPFIEKTYLTVSGRLHLESYASALGNVYSFGPRFCATRLESPKLLPEMWMTETEIAFSELQDAMNCADDFFKFLCKWVLDNCVDDMRFVCKRIDKASIDRLSSAASKPLAKVTYTEAVETLKKVDKMEVKAEWGFALTTEHISYLADEIYKGPVIIYNYPRDLKPFYVRLNDDGKTAAAFDLIVPKVGKLMSGSQSELRLDRLTKRIKELELPREQYEWYLDIKRHGAVNTSGFSFNFDLMLLFATGLTDVKDVIPFPRGLTKANN